MRDVVAALTSGRQCRGTGQDRTRQNGDLGHPATAGGEGVSARSRPELAQPLPCGTERKEGAEKPSLSDTLQTSQHQSESYTPSL